MLFQALDWTRLITVLIVQTFIAIVFLFLSYKVLKRHKTRISIICTGIFISIAAAFIINLIYLPLRVNPLVTILHIIAIFMLFVGQIFVLLFLMNLLKSKFEFAFNKQIIVFIIYLIVSFLILLIPGGITIDETTDWRPQYSYLLFIVLIIYETVFLIIPSLLLSIKIYKSFEDNLIKRKWRFYLIGYCLIAFSYYGFLLYNTLDDPLIRAIWSVLSAVTLIPGGILMYLGIGRQLQG